jgi:hypothetical protein
VLNALNHRDRQYPPGSALGRPPLAKLYKPGDYAEFAREGYLTPVRISDSRAGISFVSYSAEDYIVRKGRRSYMVVAGFTVAAKGHADNPSVMQVYAYSLDTDLDRALYPFFECLGAGPHPQPILVRPVRYEGTEGALARAWDRIAPRVFC